MRNKLKIMNEKISTLDHLDSAIDTIENKRYFEICMYYENYYPIWSSSPTKELMDFRKPLEERIKQIYLEELKKKRNEIALFLDKSITVEVENE